MLSRSLKSAATLLKNPSHVTSSGTNQPPPLLHSPSFLTLAKVLKISGVTCRLLFFSPSYTSLEPTAVLAWVRMALWKPWHLLLSWDLRDTEETHFTHGKSHGTKLCLYLHRGCRRCRHFLLFTCTCLKKNPDPDWLTLVQCEDLLRDS